VTYQFQLERTKIMVCLGKELIMSKTELITKYWNKPILSIVWAALYHMKVKKMSSVISKLEQ